MKPTKGERVLLSFTRPRYDREHKRFFPDSDRFNPVRVKIVSAVYCGVHTGDSHYCEICGRSTKTYHVFLQFGAYEKYVSDHCLRHPSTAIWRDGMKESDIKEWYTTQYIEGE